MLKVLLWGLLGLVCLLLVLLLIAFIKTLLTPKKTAAWQPRRDEKRQGAYSEKLAAMVRCETVSRPGESQREKFLAFHRLLAELFPLVHEKLEKTEIDGSLLYYWKGESHERPLVLMAHQDVVPAEGTWQHGHYSGDIDAQGLIWGRGSADDKASLMAILQAAEELLAQGYTPAQDLYISSSNTEEVGGEGCPKLVAELKGRGVNPFLVNDEGGAIITEPMAGISGNFAMVGILEKGQGNLQILAHSHGGHASAPPKNSPIARLGAFVTDMEKHYPLKSRLSPQTRAMLETLADYGPFYYRFLFGNLWLFKPLLLKLLPSLSPQAGALLRTTAAFTMQKGSDGMNVLPQEASLILNMRYIPHQGLAESNRIIEELAAKYGLSVKELKAYDYCQAVDMDSEAFRRIRDTIEEVFPGLPLVPYVMTGGTDARHFEEICGCCVRFAPILYGPAQMKGMHGLDECVDGVCLPDAVDYYKALIKRNM